jgi:hypothetical protein
MEVTVKTSVGWLWPTDIRDLAKTRARACASAARSSFSFLRPLTPAAAWPPPSPSHRSARLLGRRPYLATGPHVRPTVVRARSPAHMPARHHHSLGHRHHPHLATSSSRRLGPVPPPWATAASPLRSPMPRAATSSHAAAHHLPSAAQYLGLPLEADKS